MAEDYLPEHSVLRDLRIVAEPHPGGALARFPVCDAICCDEGNVRAGLLVTLIDAVGGRLAVQAAAPEIVATSHISLQCERAPLAGPFVAGRGALLRRGRSSLALSVELFEVDPAKPEAGERPFGLGHAAFSILGSPEVTAVAEGEPIDDVVMDLAAGSEGFSRAFLEEVGLRVVSAAEGIVEIELVEYLHNHIGALQGGIVACLADVAAEVAVRAATRAPLVTLDLSLQYLSLAKTGPFRTRCRVIRSAPQHAVCRVDVIDVGHQGRIIAVAEAVCGIVA